MNVLITGVAGLLGSNLADYLINKNINVIGIDDLSGGYIENVNDKVNFHKLNLINDVTRLNELFNTFKIDFVYHMAAYAAEGLSPFIRNYNYNNNLIATTNIVNCCVNHNVKRLIFTSTMAVYGENTLPFDEKYLPNPIDPYGIAKYACELDIKVAGEQHGLDWCIIRPHNVYGKKQNIWDKYRNVLGIWMNLHLNNKPLTIYGDGKQTRAFSYIDDSVEPLWNAAIFPEASKQIINLGGIYETSINEACDILIKVMGGGTKVHLEKRHEVKHAYSTYQKSIDILKFNHQTNLENGLTDMWTWAKNQPRKNQFIWQKYEIEKGIYNYWK
jgi:UDP-glucose 4-epimerase